MTPGPRPRRVLPRTAAVLAVSALVAGSLGSGARVGHSVASAAGNCSTDGSTTTCTFVYTGAPETWTVPGDVVAGTVATIVLDGADGGRGNYQSGNGGAGGEVSFPYPLVAGQVFQLVVGGAGASSHASRQAAPGGFGGGGNGGREVLVGGGGGGATRLATGSGVVAVAGGGGGAGAAGGISAHGSGGDGGAAGPSGSDRRGGAGGAGQGYRPYVAGAGRGGDGGVAGGSGEPGTASVDGNRGGAGGAGAAGAAGTSGGGAGGDGSGGGGAGGVPDDPTYGLVFAGDGDPGAGGAGGSEGGGGGGGAGGDGAYSTAGSHGGGGSASGGEGGLSSGPATSTYRPAVNSGRSGNGQLTISYEVPPLVAPAVTTQPDDVTVREGQTATFTASASGFPSPTVQWQRSADGQAFTDVPGATSTTYTTPAATASDDAARFRAVFSNAVASANSRAATLTVQTPPVFETASALPDGTVGTAYSSRIVYGGTPRPTATVVAGRLPPGLALGDDSVLSGTPTSTGSYSFTLRADNPAGEAQRTFTLTIGAGATSTSAAPVPSSPGPVRTLPTTGIDGWHRAGLLLLLGAVALRLGTRRRSPSSCAASENVTSPQA